MTDATRSGFTLTELLIVTVLLGLVIGGLHRAHVQQRRFTAWQQQVASSHDAFRVANSIFASVLREAVVPEGDITLGDSTSMTARSPLGLGFVCDRRGNPAILALSLAVGRMPTTSQDSVLAYAPSGWRVLEFVSEDRPGQRGMGCVTDGSTPDFQFRVQSGGTDEIPVGAPVRVFRTYRYHLVPDADGSWLARSDAVGTEALIGPLTRDGLRFRYMDSGGQPTDRQSEAVGIEIRLVARGVGEFGAPLQDTLTMLFQGRNR